jgi:hypothetical protein
MEQRKMMFSCAKTQNDSGWYLLASSASDENAELVPRFILDLTPTPKRLGWFVRLYPTHSRILRVCAEMDIE